ncbi:bifunctional folylpolyglutamate synthase/dihydrofolate synthase [Paenibacillus radicis (ex Xue et al. 2023)]|uniref:tetrahydrofolate synthase n=1 Tax=Paenibacillus radicis (ex Xue et al. 2023) TaxID=2972489 RepID=A0ABT1Y8T9_9BACL|nr:folylpolyglutamate synthase/dihydrofolate synthase family protein [Paenibacillus radicis (ex Xue et al. 2023)]MCR8629603.1 bifunctional folylpolyglutamate synthase/dihydrofolate synthase [Paenibacillus radicis (ex Xue et al. 2023)]
MSGTNEQSNVSFQSAADAVDWIVNLVKFGVRPGLKRMEKLMELLGNPERRLKFIHVAGTNGKGSVCAYLTEVLKQSGYGVGTFTSPYIEKYADRIRYNGQNIADDDLLSVVNKLKPIVDEIAASELGQPTMFEVSTAAAIEYFARISCPDYVVWETGLGGRLDSTNIVSPILTVITNVGHDHMDVLGDTLEKVAGEKAGIIKSGVPVVSAVTQPEVIDVIEQTAKAKNSTLYLMNRNFHFESLSSLENDQTFDFFGPYRNMTGLGISLNGKHQLTNASVALMAIELLRQFYALIVEDEVLLQAMKETKWAGRLEMVSHSPRILIDGAHNPEGGAALAQALRDTYHYNKLHFMMGMLSTKNHSGYLRHILPLVDTLILTEPNWHKKEEASRLADLAETLLKELGRSDVDVIVEPDWKTALDRLNSLIGQDDLAVVSGTLYLIGDVRSWILHQTDSEKGW